MKFGFDIDDTLIDLRGYAFQLYQEKLGREVARELFDQLNRVEIHELFDLTDEEGSKMWNSSLAELYYAKCPVYPGALEILQQLDKEGHEIFYITARDAVHGEETKNWLKSQGFPVKDSQFYCGMKDHEKFEIIKKLELDYYFDDKPAVIDTLSSDSLNVIIRDQSYNRHVEGLRLADWSEFHQLVKSKTN